MDINDGTSSKSNDTSDLDDLLRFIGSDKNSPIPSGLSLATLDLNSGLDGNDRAVNMFPRASPVTAGLAFEGFEENKEDASQVRREIQAGLQKSERLKKQKVRRQQVRRTQRYLGLYPLTGTKAAGGENFNSKYGILAPAGGLCPRSGPITQNIDPAITFVCVDIEAFEFNSKIITEVGISTLSTASLVHVDPGPQGENWVPFIISRHLRVIEHKNYRNKVHVEDNAENFTFGKSEWIHLCDVIPTLKAAFSPPLVQVLNPMLTNAHHPHKIIFVAHNKNSEVNYLTDLGFPVDEHIYDCVDSSDLFQAAHRDKRQASLQKILAAYDIGAQHLHNAGNDAHYTLRAVIAIAVDQAMNKKTDVHWEVEREKRLAIAIKEATERVNAELEGWSTGDGESEGDGKAEVVFAANVARDRRASGAGKGGERVRGRGRGGPRARGSGRGMASAELGPAAPTFVARGGENLRGYTSQPAPFGRGGGQSLFDYMKPGK